MSRLLHAGRRLSSNQVPDRRIPGDRNAPGFDDKSVAYDTSNGGSLVFVSLIPTCPRYVLGALTPTLTTTALDRSSLEWFEARS